MSTDLILERTVSLPPHAVWRAWTEPALLMQWFCPKPWQTVECDIELRPGGRFNTVMQGPGGERHVAAGCILEVDAPHRLVWTSALGAGYVPVADDGVVPLFTCVLTFEAVDGGTRYTARAVHRDAAVAEKHSAMGFHDGWGKALEQLVDTMSTQMKGHVAEG
jgi:uncharacterized protein YndB with AHSA1/START domain